jgi:DNA polymerase-3 subunit beta
MNVSISRNSLQSALQNLAKATPTRSTIPILSSVLFTARKEKLEMRTTDLEITLVTTAQGSVESEGGVAIPHRTLMDITNALPETDVTIESNDEHRVVIQTSFGNYDISGAPPEDFPTMPEVDNKKEIGIASSVLKRLVEKTSFALSSDDLKPALMGALFEVLENSISVVATDGHRLSVCSRSDFSSRGYEGRVIVPKKFLNLLLPYLDGQGETVLWVGDNHLTISFSGITAFSRVIDERYPDYKTVLPKDNSKILTADREEMLASVRRVSIFSNRATRQVELRLSNGEAVVTTEDPESASSAQEKFQVQYEDEDLTVGFNANYLVDILSHIDTEKVVLRLNSPISATLVGPDKQEENEETTMLLMPMRTGGEQV